MKLKFIKCLIIGVLLSSEVVGQIETTGDFFRLPLNITTSLSGNFGEPRSRHFHTGLDFNTAVEGMEVVAVADGYVSRISVSPWGYGLALYVDHPNGYTTVYAHLSKYNPEIQNFVREIQYVNHTFKIDTVLLPNRIQVRKGQVIAYSGNTGQSEGPHLHYEFRETKSERPVNPVNKIYFFKDKTPPEITKLVLYPMNKNSYINGKNSKQIFNLTKNKNGEYVCREELPEVLGVIGVGLAYVDRMDGTTNRYGAESVTLTCDSSVVYKSTLQKLDFDKQRAKNSMLDYQYFLEDELHVHKLFVEQGNDLQLYDRTVNDGLISITGSEQKKFEIAVYDYNGNSSVMKFSLEGDNSDYKYISENCNMLLSVDSGLVYCDGGFRLEFDPSSVFNDYCLNVKNLKKWKYSDVYSVGEDFVAVKKDFRVMFFLDDKLLPIKDKLFIGRKRGDDYSFLKPEINQNYISSTSSYFGEFYLWIDTTAPVITPVNIKEGTDLSKSQSIKVKISDDLSGISTYNMFINDSWVLCQYDPRKQTVTYFFDDKCPSAETYEFKIVVEDNLENVSEFKAKFRYAK